MAQPGQTPLSAELILRLQATAGNRAVQRLIETRYAPEPDPQPATPQPVPQTEINRAIYQAVCAPALGAAAGALLWLYDRSALPFAITLPFVAASIVWTVQTRMHRKPAGQ
jgi:hypothetical protein